MPLPIRSSIAVYRSLADVVDKVLVQDTVIMFTGVKDRSCHSRAQGLEVKEFLVKGEYDPKELIKLVDKHLEGSGERTMTPAGV